MQGPNKSASVDCVPSTVGPRCRAPRQRVALRHSLQFPSLGLQGTLLSYSRRCLLRWFLFPKSLIAESPWLSR